MVANRILRADNHLRLLNLWGIFGSPIYKYAWGRLSNRIEKINVCPECGGQLREIPSPDGDGGSELVCVSCGLVEQAEPSAAHKPYGRHPASDYLFKTDALGTDHEAVVRSLMRQNLLLSPKTNETKQQKEARTQAFFKLMYGTVPKDIDLWDHYLNMGKERLSNYLRTVGLTADHGVGAGCARQLKKFLREVFPPEHAYRIEVAERELKRWKKETTPSSEKIDKLVWASINKTLDRGTVEKIKLKAGAAHVH